MKKISWYLKCVLSLVLSLSLVACLSPVKVGDKTNYVINSRPCDIVKKKKRGVTILVLVPDASAAYNTTQMAYSIKPHSVAYFAKNQWVETPPQMLQPLLVHTLLASGTFKAVVSAPYVGLYDYALITNITLLQQNFIYSPPTLYLTVQAQILNAATARVVADKEFAIAEPMAAATPYAGVVAANRAMVRLLTQLEQFALANAR